METRCHLLTLSIQKLGVRRMACDLFLQSVTEVLALVRAHSEKVHPTRPRSTLVQRWSARLTVAGGFLFFVATVSQAAWVSDARTAGSTLALLLVGTIALLGGLLTSVVDSVRTAKRPFADHVDRIVELLPAESDLLNELQRFETPALEFARKRLNLESEKVTSRLEMIGGGERLSASWIGIALLGFAVLSQYKSFDVTTGGVGGITLLGLALLLGLSIGALFVRYGASRSNYYSGILGLAIERKMHVAQLNPAAVSTLAEQGPVPSPGTGCVWNRASPDKNSLASESGVADRKLAEGISLQRSGPG